MQQNKNSNIALNLVSLIVGTIGVSMIIFKDLPIFGVMLFSSAIGFRYPQTITNQIYYYLYNPLQTKNILISLLIVALVVTYPYFFSAAIFSLVTSSFVFLSIFF